MSFDSMHPIQTPPAGPDHEGDIAQILREEIARSGAIPFDRFMDICLYHPGLGYYRQPRQPIGKDGDYFTASQVQPVFGRLVRRYCELLCAEYLPGSPRNLVELGPGRGEMASAFQGWQYKGFHAGAAPEVGGLEGVVYANELFDALPVKAVRYWRGRYWERMVTWKHGSFQWTEREALDRAFASYASSHMVPQDEGFHFEVHQSAIAMLHYLLTHVRKALLVFIDYGYTQREWKRFPEGTLMSYSRHQASPEVLAEPGMRDITSHVPFSILMNEAAAQGAELLRFETMAQALLYAGESDQFAEAIQADDPQQESLLRQQLKLLLYGMGENFRVLVLRKQA
ncbi:MAG: SAM-dependent methyltransferase [Bryobacterales bacterium]|jgi:SAM-dependent MidA family methyltransferase|nr:SAM-dependent methyltransferase [Bryobacterales bacterium]